MIKAVVEIFKMDSIWKKLDRKFRDLLQLGMSGVVLPIVLFAGMKRSIRRCLNSVGFGHIIWRFLDAVVFDHGVLAISGSCGLRLGFWRCPKSRDLYTFFEDGFKFEKSSVETLEIFLNLVCQQ